MCQSGKGLHRRGRRAKLWCVRAIAHTKLKFLCRVAEGLSGAEEHSGAEEWMMRQRKSSGKELRFWWRQRIAVGLALVLLLLFSGRAFAAEVLSGDPYILPRGEVVNDDLYVTGGEVIIDGTIEGDLVVAGGYVEVNGVVMGDLLAAGGAVVIAGAIQDDVRAAGGAVILSGSVGDDMFGAAGGGWPGARVVPMVMPAGTMGTQARNVPQGLQINAGSTIGGDLYIAGGQGTVAGSIGSNLVAAMGSLTLAGRVAGDANLTASSLTVQDSTVVQGELSYATRDDTVIPEGVAASVVAQPPLDDTPAAPERRPVRDFIGWLLRTALVLAGYLIAGWLLWSFAPRQITDPVAVMEARPMEAGITGLLAAVAVVPLGAAVAFLAGLFWGWFPGSLIVVMFVLGLVALIWLLSPLLTGLWVGRKIGEWTGAVDGELPRLLVGIATIVLAARILAVIPCIGDLAFQVIFLGSFVLAVGSWFLARRHPPAEAVLLPAPVSPAVY
jgi:hypothetical protein